MSSRRLLAGLAILALLSFFWIQLRNSADHGGRGEAASSSPSSPANQTAAIPAEPEPRALNADALAEPEEVCIDIEQQWESLAAAEPWEELQQSAFEQLAASSSAEQLHAAALVATDPEAQLELIKRAVELNSTDPLLLWTAVRLCSESQDALDCPLQEWLQQLTAVNGQNSAAWVQVASNRYTAGDTDAALEAMRSAATSAESRIYWPEMMELVERELSAVSNYSFPVRVSIAMSVAGMELPHTSVLTTMCREQSSEDPEWAYTCLSYGELAERQAKNFYSIAVAGSVQQIALEAIGEPERASQVQDRIDMFRQELMSFNDIEALNQMHVNPGLFYSYIEALKTVGEGYAYREIAPEAERLASRCAGSQPEQLTATGNARPEWITTRDKTETEAIYTALVRESSPDSIERFERSSGLSQPGLEVFMAVAAKASRKDQQFQLETMDLVCDQGAPMTGQVLLARLESMFEQEAQMQQEAVDELLLKLPWQDVEALRTRYSPDTRSFNPQTQEPDFAAMIEATGPGQIQEAACTELAAARLQRQDTQ